MNRSRKSTRFEQWMGLQLTRDPRLVARFYTWYEWLATLPRPTRRWLGRKLALTFTAVALLMALSGMPVRAAAITVDPGAAGFNSLDGCSLVEAIVNANNDDQSGSTECVAGSGADTITLPAAADLKYVKYYGGTVALPVAYSQITIEGNGTTIERDTVNATDNFGIVAVGADGNLTLNDVTIANGIGNVMFVAGGVTNFRGTLTLNDSTVSGNKGFAGGLSSFEAIFTTVNGTTFEYNYGLVAGGVGSFYAPTTVSDSTVNKNYSSEAAGGVTNAFGSTTLNRTTVTGNLGPLGGGIFNYFNPSQPYETIVRLNSSTVSGNGAAYGGGINNGHLFGTNLKQEKSAANGKSDGTTFQVSDAIKAAHELKQEHAGIAALKDSKFHIQFDPKALKPSKISGTFAGHARKARVERHGKGTAPKQAPKHSMNHSFPKPGPNAPTDGVGGFVYINQSTISDNKAEYDGGGIANNYNYSAVLLFNTTVSGNQAYGGYGGGIDNYGGFMASVNSTISGNTAASFGGGIDNELGGRGGAPAEFELLRTIVSGNTATNGSNEIDNYSSTVSAYDFNLFGESSETYAQAFYNFLPDPTDIAATSDDPNPGADTFIPTALASILNSTLGNHGGPTETLALVSGSPAIDRAPNSECVGTPINGVDQRNFSRNVDGNGSPSSNECDIGAYEYASTTAVSLTRFGAQLGKAGNVTVRWHSSSEAELAGFNVWRKIAKGKWKKVNVSFLQAKHSGDAAGASYRFMDEALRHPETYRYKLQIVYLDGHKEWSDVIGVR